MVLGKSLNFIVGLSAGVVFMFAVSYFSGQRPVSGKSDSPDPEVKSSATVPVSPFTAVAQESIPSDEPVAEPASVVAVDDPDIATLLQRIEEAEARIEALEGEVVEIQTEQFLPGDTPSEDEQQQLLSSVFEPATVSQIQTIRNESQLQRLELRDLASREGWINTDRFRQEIRSLNNKSQLRETLGDDGFDQLLLAEGRSNRVQIESIIENSSADLAGLEVGDMVLSYANERIFNFRDLRGATTGGVRDELVPIQVARNDELIELVIARGPMGVTLSGVTGDVSP